MAAETSEKKAVFTINTLIVMVSYSFYKAVAYNSYVTNFSLTEDAYGYISDLPFMIGASVGIVAAALMVFVLARKRKLTTFGLDYRIPLLVLAACYLVAPLFLTHVEPLIVLPCLGLIWGAVSTLITITFVEIFVFQESAMAFILQLACAYFFSAVIAAVFGQLSQVVNVLVFTVLALACIPLIAKCRANSSPYTVVYDAPRTIDATKVSDSGLWPTIKVAAAPILAYFCFELVVGLINMFAFEGSSSFSISTTAPIQGMLICSVLIVAFVFITHRVPSPAIIYNAVFPAIIAIFLILPFFGESLGKPISSVIYAAYVFTSMFSVFCYVTAARQAKADIYQVSSLVSAGVRIMLMIGIMLGYCFSHMIQAETYVHISIVAVVCVYCLGVVIVYWSYRNSRNREKTAEPEAKQAESYEEAVASRVEFLVEHYGLTNRERDVLVGLSKGNSAARIAEDLFISTSTAQGYIKSLYAKLGVNKKQQVLDLFNLEA